MMQARRPFATRRRLLTAALSVVGHAAIVAVVVQAQPEPPRAVELAPIAVELVTPAPPPPEPPPKPKPEPEEPAPPKAEKPKTETPKVEKAKAEKPKAAKPEPQKAVARPTRNPPPTIDSLLSAANQGAEAGPSVEMSDSEVAGAATAGSGTGGGGCNMPRLLQTALRKDRQVRAAVAQAHRGKAIRVWNGNWVRHPGQEGNGLAAVREAIMWEVGFAPEACRTERVHGLVLLSLNDAPGGARIVVGSGDWRWSDLLNARRRQ